MADAITTNDYRRKLASAMAAGAVLAPITHVAFGDGGHNPETFTPIQPTQDQSALNNELLRKPLALISQETEFSVTGKGVLDNEELVGYTISEVALIDADGLVVGIDSHGPALKSGKDAIEVNVTLRF